MDIKSVTNGNNVYFQKDLPQKGQDQSGNANVKIQDKLELSQEAQNIQNSANQVPRSEEISRRINNKFYDSNEVVSQIADKILSEINKTK